MPKKVTMKNFRTLGFLNAWLGRAGKNHRIINIVPKVIYDYTTVYDVYVEEDISGEEWYLEHIGHGADVR